MHWATQPTCHKSLPQEILELKVEIYIFNVNFQYIKQGGGGGGGGDSFSPILAKNVR